MEKEVLIIRGVGAHAISAATIGKGRTEEQIRDFLKEIVFALSRPEGTFNNTAPRANNTSNSNSSKTQGV